MQCMLRTKAKFSDDAGALLCLGQEGFPAVRGYKPRAVNSRAEGLQLPVFLSKRSLSLQYLLHNPFPFLNPGRAPVCTDRGSVASPVQEIEKDRERERARETRERDGGER